MNKHCGNCIKQDWCKANEGNGGNQDCADWQPKKLCPECGHKAHEGRCEMRVMHPHLGFKQCECDLADLQPEQSLRQPSPLKDVPTIATNTTAEQDSRKVEKHCNHIYVQGDELPICEKCGNVLLIRKKQPTPTMPLIEWTPLTVWICPKCGESTPINAEAHDQQVRKAEWRRIFQHMHITRKQLLALPLDIRQDILTQQVDNYVQNISDEEKLEDLRKLD